MQQKQNKINIFLYFRRFLFFLSRVNPARPNPLLGMLHQLFKGQMPFLSPKQQQQSTEESVKEVKPRVTRWHNSYGV